MADMADSSTIESAATDSSTIDSATDSATPDNTTEANVPDNTIDSAPVAAAPVKAKRQRTIKLADTSPVGVARANVADIEAAIKVASAGSMLAGILNGSLADALQALALAESSATAEAAHADRLAEADTLALTLPASIRAATLAAMRAAIDSEYAPVATEAAPVAEADTYTGRQPASANTLAANVVAAADSTLTARMPAYLAAFNADAGKLNCSANRLANTRFSGLCILAPSGAGVANGSDYASCTRSMRAYLISLGWPAGIGQSVPQLTWLAARKNYGRSGNKPSATAECFKQSGAALALYSDGTFKLAYPGTAGVRFVATDEAAWRLFAGAGTGAVVAAAPVAAEAAPATVARIIPTAPLMAANPLTGALMTLAKCQHCHTDNLTALPTCRKCKAADWQAI